MLAKGLLEFETLSGDEITDLLKGKKPNRELVLEPTTPRTSAVPPAASRVRVPIRMPASSRSRRRSDSIPDRKRGGDAAFFMPWSGALYPILGCIAAVPWHDSGSRDAGNRARSGRRSAAGMKREGKSMRFVTGLGALSALALSGAAGGCIAAEMRGVTATEIRIGQTMPYSGPVSAFGALGKGEVGYFKMLNEHGGINGRKINLISLDDGYAPPKTVEQTGGWWRATRSR